MVIIEAKEKQFFAVSGRDCRIFLFGLSYKQKNQIKSRKNWKDRKEKRENRKEGKRLKAGIRK